MACLEINIDFNNYNKCLLLIIIKNKKVMVNCQSNMRKHGTLSYLLWRLIREMPNYLDL